jgi:hypothetical protein
LPNASNQEKDASVCQTCFYIYKYLEKDFYTNLEGSHENYDESPIGDHKKRMRSAKEDFEDYKAAFQTFNIEDNLRKSESDGEE